MSTLSRSQAYSYAYGAGFTGVQADTIVAIAQAESGLVTDARNYVSNPSSWDRGILQINSYYWSSYSDACCDDPACAFAAGYYISSSGTDFRPWVTYLNGAWLNYIRIDLPGFPMVNQLDGTENANYNCVPTSAVAAIRYLQGSGPPPTPDELKDYEYGGSYVGGTAFAYYCDNSGDRMRAQYHCNGASYTHYGDSTYLVNQIHSWLTDGWPVLATIPSSWGTVYSQSQRDYPSFSSHVVVFYKEIDGGGLVAMNPWGGFAHEGSNQYWDDRLCFGQVWRVYGEMSTQATTGGKYTIYNPTPGTVYYASSAHWFRPNYRTQARFIAETYDSGGNPTNVGELVIYNRDATHGHNETSQTYNNTSNGGHYSTIGNDGSSYHCVGAKVNQSVAKLTLWAQYSGKAYSGGGGPTGTVSVYNGGTWDNAAVSVYNGGTWDGAGVTVYNGSVWQ